MRRPEKGRILVLCRCFAWLQSSGTDTMKHRALLCSLAVLCYGVLPAMSAEKPAVPSEKLLRHVVLFKFKETSSDEQVRQIVDAFRALPKQIDAIHDFEWGTDVSVENKAAGFTHCFLVTFRDAKGRDEYLPHPAHKEFVKLVGPHLDKVLVFDYVTGE